MVTVLLIPLLGGNSRCIMPWNLRVLLSHSVHIVSANLPMSNPSGRQSYPQHFSSSGRVILMIWYHIALSTDHWALRTCIVTPGTWRRWSAPSTRAPAPPGVAAQSLSRTPWHGFSQACKPLHSLRSGSTINYYMTTTRLQKEPATVNLPINVYVTLVMLLPWERQSIETVLPLNGATYASRNLTQGMYAVKL